MRIQQFFTNLPIERKLWLLSVVPILTIGTLSVVTYQSVKTFSHDEDELNHVYHVQTLSAEYMRLVVDLETGFRGFVLTQQPKFLQPYQAAKKRVLAVSNSLQAMVREDPEQRQLVKRVQDLVQQLITDKEQLIEEAKRGNTEAALSYIETGQGRTLMTAIREAIARFDRREVEFLRHALSSSSQDRSFLLGVVIGGGMLALIFMILPLHLIARSITGPLTTLAKTVGNVTGEIIPDVPVLNRQDEIGDLTRVMHTMTKQIRDYVDQIKKSETELRLLNVNVSESEAKYRSIVDHAPIGIFTVQQGNVIFSNQENQLLAGQKNGSADPEVMWNAIHPEDRERVMKAFSRATAQNVPYEGVFRFLHPDGQIRKVFSRAVPIPDHQGQTLAYQGFHVDITTLEAMRERLGRAERLATLGQVAAGIAHEIRNPLVGIGSTASLLLEEFPEDDDRRKDLQTILEETKRLDRIVNQIVGFAKPRTFLPTPFSPEETIQKILKLLQHTIQDQDITVNIDKPDHPVIIEADQDQITQVLLNVIQNALEAMPPHRHLTISIKEASHENEPGVQLIIQDQGVGINEQDLAHIFDPFFTSGKQRGTGLGLAICRNLIDQHRGDITVASQKGHGTTITIWLPAAQPIEARDT